MASPWIALTYLLDQDLDDAPLHVRWSGDRATTDAHDQVFSDGREMLETLAYADLEDRFMKIQRLSVESLRMIAYVAAADLEASWQR